MTMKYKFVHVTKTGGSYFFHVCQQFDLPVLFKNTHEYICTNRMDYRNITIIRDPVERFVSAYNQYLHGTCSWPKDQQDSILTMDNILDMIHGNTLHPDLLPSKFIYPHHFKRQTSWVKPSHGRNTVLVYYNNKLSREIQELCDFLEFDVGTLDDVRVNYPTKREFTADSLPQKTKNKINFVYKHDCDLFYNRDRNRKAFYKVIGDNNE